MGWSITSNKSYSLGTIDDNGLATFSEHTEDIVYTVTYSDGNYTCSKAITVHACRPDCLCENVDLRAEATAGGNSIPAVGYDTDTVIGTFDDTTCLSSLTVSSSQTWVKGLRISGHNIYAQVDENESLLSARTATITITGKDGENADCPDDFIVTQVPSASTCTCENVDLRAEATAAGSSIPASGYDIDTVIGTYDNGTCLTDITATSNKNWITITNVSNGNVSATVSENASLTDSKEATITVSGVDAYGTTCSDPFIVTQVPSASTCTCENVDLRAEATAGGNSIPAEGYNTDTLVGTYDNGTCLTSIGVGKDPTKTWITSLSVSNGNVYAKIDPNISLELSRDAIITVSGKDAYDVTCTDDFPITQEKSAVTCTCNEFTVSPREGCVPVSAGTNNIGTYTDGGCVTDIAAYNLPDWLSSVNFSNGTISGTVTKNEGTAKREATISVSGSAAGNTCTRDLYVCQEACVDATYVYSINDSYTTEDGCATTSHVRVACSAYTCDGTYISGSAQKGVYFVDSSLNDYELPANETLATSCYTINIYGHIESPTTFTLYGVVNTTISNVGYTFLKSIQVCVPPCICGEVPGTDNFFVDSQHRHVLTLQNDEGSTYSTGDTCICGWGGRCSQVSVTSQGTWYEDHDENVVTSAGTPGSFVTAVLNSGSMGYYAYTDNFADYDRLERLTLTPINNSCTFDPEGDTGGRCKCTGGRSKVLSSSWDVIIRQSPKYRCGCSAYLWTVAPGGIDNIPREGGEILLGTVQITNFVCGDHDDVIINVASGVRSWIISSRCQIRPGVARYVDVYITLAENNTGGSRTTNDGDLIITTYEGMCKIIGAPIVTQLG